MNNSAYHPKYIPTWIGIGILRLLSFLPYAWMMGIAQTLGKWLNKKLNKRYLIAKTNIDLCFSEKNDQQREKIVENTMINMVKGLFETLLAWWAPDRFFAKHCRYEGLDLIKHYQDQGRGVLLVGAHYTTLDFSGRAMARLLDVDLTYKKQKNLAFDQLIRVNREKFFGHVIEKKAMRTMVRNLKNGRCVWYAPDQDFGREGSVFVPFFGIDCATLTTTHKLLKITGAKALYFEHLRLTENGKTIYRSKVYDIFDDELLKEETECARQVNLAIENSVSKYPDQYFWHHERFRTRPSTSDPSLYPKKRKKK